MHSLYCARRHRTFRNIRIVQNVLKRLFSIFHWKFDYKHFVKVPRTKLTSVSKQLLDPITKCKQCIFIANCYKHEECDSESDSDDFTDLESGVMDVESLRHFLYPESIDPIICKLKGCASVQEVFDIIVQHEASIKGSHSSQAVLVLWDLQKIYFQVSVSSLNLDPQITYTNYINEISTHGDFKHLLQIVEKNVAELSPDAAACTLLYLIKMRLNMNHSVMQSLVNHFGTLLDEYGPDFPLTALSRFTVALNDQRGLWYAFVMQKAMPHIIEKMESCNIAENFRQLTICLNNIHQLVSLPILEKYKEKVDTLILNGVITSQEPRTIVKAVTFLNYPFWSHHNAATIRELLHLLKEKVSTLEPKDLLAVHKVFQSQLEPADLLEEIQDYAAQLLSREGDFLSVFHSTTDLLSCVASFSSPTQKIVFEELAQNHMEKNNFSTSMVSLFKILRHLKTSNMRLCDAFWSKTLNNLESSSKEREDYRLLRLCHRYMYFNNNLGGTYRHYEFENYMINLLLEEIKNGIAGLIPSKFARIAAFLVAYGSMQQDKDGTNILNMVTEKLIGMEAQLTEIDCLNISRGFQIATELRRQKNVSPQSMENYVRLDALLNRCTRHQLKATSSTLADINLMTRTYTNRRGTRDTELFQGLISRYEHFDGTLSSRLLRDVAYNLQVTNCLIPAIVDRLVEYVVKHNVHLLGDTVEKVLHLCYSQGYSPTQGDAFLPIAAQVIIRDKNRLSGLKLLQAALSFCFFRNLPEALIQFIFTVDFLERLDEEIFHCYSKATYPVRVRHLMMQLNRAVCLDYPEADVPWFHQKYCEEIEALDPVQSSAFHLDVKKTMVGVLGGKGQFIKADAYTPYGYKIDFQVLMKQKNIPVYSKYQSDKNITRVAVLLHKPDDFCSNVPHLKGHLQLKQRHLEMLGYRIVSVNSTLWHSMFMAEPGAKEDFLKKKLWAGLKNSLTETL